MKLIFFDDQEARLGLLPLTFRRPVSDLRLGILKVREKWEHHFGVSDSADLANDYLSGKFPFDLDEGENLFIKGCLLPDNGLLDSIMRMELGSELWKDGRLLAFKVNKEQAEEIHDAWKKEKQELDRFIARFSLLQKGHAPDVRMIRSTWDLFSQNGEAIQTDLPLLTQGRESESVSPSNGVLGKDIFIEKGAKVEHATLNASSGPIYIGKDAEIMEGSTVRGPFAMGANATLKMGTKIYGPTTVGPFSKVGGEVNNSVFQGFSNKGHDGFLGNSVIGEWCNLGADTNTSNLKNDYGEVKMWSYQEEKMVSTGLQFCGLIMGDHSKCGINTMFNTGTVIGVNANIFGSGFPPKFIPSFSWGGAEQGFETYKLEKALQVARQVCERRKVDLDETEEDILRKVFTETKKYREKR